MFTFASSDRTQRLVEARKKAELELRAKSGPGFMNSQRFGRVSIANVSSVAPTILPSLIQKPAAQTSKQVILPIPVVMLPFPLFKQSMQRKRKLEIITTFDREEESEMLQAPVAPRSLKKRKVEEDEVTKEDDKPIFMIEEFVIEHQDDLKEEEEIVTTTEDQDDLKEDEIVSIENKDDLKEEHEIVSNEHKDDLTEEIVTNEHKDDLTKEDEQVLTKEEPNVVVIEKLEEDVKLTISEEQKVDSAPNEKESIIVNETTIVKDSNAILEKPPVKKRKPRSKKE